MTRLAIKADPRKTPSLAPLSAPRSLTHEVVERLRGDITNGKMPPGSRLPTEQEMIASLGVSRTVVREAVAALRAEGLVATRQGVGAFVADRANRTFRIEPTDVKTINEVLEVMELRTGIEIEAAGLAAERATPESIRKITEAYDGIQAAMMRGESGIDEDFAFHCAIAEATGNPKFLNFLNYLGNFIIPRQTINLTSVASQRSAYLRTFQTEHGAILNAIKVKAVTQARAAMRQHLLNSRKRYSKLSVSEKR